MSYLEALALMCGFFFSPDLMSQYPESVRFDEVRSYSEFFAPIEQAAIWDNSYPVTLSDFKQRCAGAGFPLKGWHSTDRQDNTP
ncbi:MAG: hypothetical protein LBU76_08795 [Azoarcus sp.]|nr:hypothetical protein [Azoarcus sp.]